MRIVGEWRRFDDGVHRPVLRARLQASDGTFLEDLFLVDVGADRTVLLPEWLRNFKFLRDQPVRLAFLESAAKRNSSCLAQIIHGPGKTRAVCRTQARRASEGKSLATTRLRVGLVWGHE